MCVCVCACVCARARMRTQSYLTIYNPMDCSPPGSSVHGILQARILEWLPLPSPGNLLNPGIEPGPPALSGPFFTTEPPNIYWSKSLFGFLHKMLQKNSNKLFGQPRIYSITFTSSLKIKEEISIEKHEPVFNMNK